jgi:hypothetical protein
MIKSIALSTFIYIKIRKSIVFDYSATVPVYSGQFQARASAIVNRCNMKTITRKQARESIETIKAKGLASAIGIRATGASRKQIAFAEKVVLDGMNSSQAYRASYNTKAKASTINVEAHKLMRNPKVANTIEALERAKEAAALHSIESLKALVISTLTDIATNSDKDAVRVQAVKTLGTVVGVDMFRETKRIETVKDSDEIKNQIMQQLKSMMLGNDDAETVDATELLAELSVKENQQDSDPTAPTPPETETGTPTLDGHTIPHEQSPQLSEDPPISQETPTPLGDIFLEKGK